jgi:penicillin amidase
MRGRRIYSILLSLYVVLSQVPSSQSTSQGQHDGKNKRGFSRELLHQNGEEITIIRDGFGVPHVFADTESGVYFGGGYATAQDRLFQMERLRRDARGELAEIDGPPAFFRDWHMRYGPTEPAARAMFDALPAGIRQSMKSYADGVNKFINECVSKGTFPSGFKEAGIVSPAQWTVTDTILIGVGLAERFGSRRASSPANLAILKLLRAKFGNHADGLFNDLFWEDDPKTTVSINDGGGPGQQSGISPRSRIHIDLKLRLNELSDEALAEAQREVNDTAVYQYAEAHNLPSRLGSYGWAVSPKLSAGGNPILVGGPQMGFTIPSIGYEIHYCGGGLNVAGMAIAGIPGVIIGHNDRVAWTITTGASDMKVVYEEQLNPHNHDQYLYKGRYRDMEKRVEVFKIKGEQPREHTLRWTVHGAVMYQAQPWPPENPRIVFSRHPMYADHEFDTFSGLHAINRAKDLTDVGTAVQRIYTNQNFIAASVDGDIGYWHAGRHPLPFKGLDRRFPVPGNGEYDQINYLAPSEIPQIINPAQGFIMNWNSKPIRGWSNGDMPLWGEASAGRRIEELLKSRKLASFEDVRDITQDIATYDTSAALLLPFLMASIENTSSAQRDRRVEQAAAYLRAWSMRALDGSVGKTIFDEWLNQIRDGLFARYFGDLKTLAVPFEWPGFYNIIVNDSFILHVLEGSKSALPPSQDYFDGRKKDDVLVELLQKALDRIGAQKGPQMNLWSFEQGEITFKGAAGIPNVNRGTYIFAIELSKPLQRCVSVLAPGESEDPNSPHFADQVDLAGFWRYKELPCSRDLIEKAASEALKHPR